MTRREVKPLHDILSDYSRDDAIRLIDKFVRKYEKFINATTPITQRYVAYTENPYADKSDEFICSDIKFTILIIYFATITEEGAKKIVAKAFEGVFGSLKKLREIQKEGEN